MHRDLIQFGLSCGIRMRFFSVNWVSKQCEEETIMEKICTRCNFRNPRTRSVCQVCGHPKFFTMTDAQAAVAKQPMFTIAFEPSSAALQLTELVQQTKNTAINALQKITSTVKLNSSNVDSKQNGSASKVHDIRTMQSDSQLETNTPVFNDGDDLDSMIAWFKSYGVDRPLILEPKPKQQPSPHSRKAA